MTGGILFRGNEGDFMFEKYGICEERGEAVNRAEKVFLTNFDFLIDKWREIW